MADRTGVPVPPRAMTTAVVLAIGGAVVLAAIALFDLTQIDATRRALIAGGQPAAQVDAALLVAFSTAVGGTLVLAAALITFALLLRTGRSWARVGLVSASIVSALTVVVLGGASVFGVVMLGAADVIAFQRPVTEWLRAVRLRRGI